MAASPDRRSWARWLFTGEGIPYLLTPLIPVALALELADASASVIFVTAALGIIPTAALMGRATEELATRSGPGIGGLLNVTFGNFPELVIAFFALLKGLQEVVKASIIGSILGNILLVHGRGDVLRRAAAATASTSTAPRRAPSPRCCCSRCRRSSMPAVFELVAGGGLPR